MRKSAFALFVLATLFFTASCGAEGSVRKNEPFLVDVPPGVELSLGKREPYGRKLFADDLSIRTLNSTPQEMLAVLKIAKQFNENCDVGSFRGSGFFGEPRILVTLPDGRFMQGREARWEIDDNETGIVSVYADAIMCTKDFTINKEKFEQ